MSVPLSNCPTSGTVILLLLCVPVGLWFADGCSVYEHTKKSGCHDTGPTGHAPVGRLLRREISFMAEVGTLHVLHQLCLRCNAILGLLEPTVQVGLW